MTWKAMEHFIKENRGLIIKICRKYRIAPSEHPEIPEDAYIHAVKTYDPQRANSYTFTSHFCQHLKSLCRKEVTYRNKMVFLEDIFSKREQDVEW